MIKISSIGRACDGCTKCCEGWLYGTAYGYDFSPYKKCAFLNKGCSIYPLRPASPCKSFQCQWKANRSLPEWLKPDKSDVIILGKMLKEFKYLFIVPAGKKINTQVYEWAEKYSKENERNNTVISDESNYKIFSQNKLFKELAKKEYKV